MTCSVHFTFHHSRSKNVMEYLEFNFKKLNMKFNQQYIPSVACCYKAKNNLLCYCTKYQSTTKWEKSLLLCFLFGNNVQKSSDFRNFFLIWVKWYWIFFLAVITTQGSSESSTFLNWIKAIHSCIIYSMLFSMSCLIVLCSFPKPACS